MEMIVIATAMSLAAIDASGAPSHPAFGVNFSPYLDGQDGSLGLVLKPQQIASRLEEIKGYSEWIRTFSVTHGMENAGALAHRAGFKTALGAWLGPEYSWDTTGDYGRNANEAEIASLIAVANRGDADMVIVGSEVLLRGDLASTQLVAYINEVRANIPPGIPITTSDTCDMLEQNPDVMDACDVIMADIYPFWEGVRIDAAMSTLDDEYQTLVRSAGAKEVWIGETGWPSGGNPVGSAVPNTRNATYYFLAFNSWAQANGVNSFYFEAYDEAWKAANEGPQGAHWGIRNSKGILKPHRNLVYRGYVLPQEAYLRRIPSSSIPGNASIQFTSVPAYGSMDGISGIVTGVLTSDYVVATYIQAWIGWWSKPTWAQPTVPINPDGTFYVDTVTGGEDYDATDFLVFLVPRTYAPLPAAGGAISNDIYANALAYAEFPRSRCASQNLWRG
jgi:exo-beta-1,3-glucanase (GH17 family)